MEFLYFPEDKSKYIVALLTFMPFILGAFLTFWWMKRLSKKELAYMESSPDQYISKKLFSPPNVSEKTDN